MHKIQLKPDIELVIHPLRKIPIALPDKLQKELKRMQNLQDLVTVTEPTD